jgi:polysaccharide biosynthesis transport protein
MNHLDMTTKPSMASWSVVFLTRLHRYKVLLRRRWWVLALSISAMLFHAAWKVSQETPNYQSTARMMVKIRMAIPEGVAYSEELGNFYGTQIELMQCGKVQERARAQLMAKRPDLQPSPVSVNASVVAKASIFVLSAVGTDAEYTQLYLNACMDEYSKLKKEMRSQTSETTLAAITEEIGRLEQELRSGEDELFQFQKENNTVFLQEQGISFGQQLVALNREYSSASMEFNEIQQLLSRETFDPTMVSSALNVRGTELDRLLHDLRFLNAEIGDALKTVRPEHPRIQTLHDQKSNLERKISLLMEESRAKLIARRDMLQSKVQNLQTTIGETEVKALDLSRRMAEFKRISSKVSRMQGLHDKLLSSMQSIGVTRSLDQEVLSIMEPASPAISVREGVSKRLSSAFLLGLVMGCVVLGFIDRIDDRINSLTELRDHFEEPVLGQIPFENSPRTAQSGNLLLLNGGKHLYAESFRNIRSSLFFMTSEGKRPKCLLVTSASPGEGKSTVAANLAITMASSGSRVLLVDCDLRRGIVHKQFGLPSGPGLADVLSQRSRWQETVVTYSWPGLSIIPRGSHTSSPGELFLGPMADLFLSEIRQHYDCIILDSAPVLAADDTPSLAPKTDGTLFIISATLTSARLAQNSLDLLYHRNVNVLGVVFNRMDTSLPEYYYYQYNTYDPTYIDKQTVQQSLRDPLRKSQEVGQEDVVATQDQVAQKSPPLEKSV